MTITSSTFIILFLMILMVRRGPYRGVLILFLLMPFGMMAAFSLPAFGNTTILGADLAVLGLGVMFLFRKSLATDLGAVFALKGPAIALLGFFAYAVIASLFFPRMFAGETEVFSIGRVANQIGIVMRPLSANIGNLSQLFRLVLSLTVFLVAVLAMMRRQDPALGLRAMTIVTVTHASLGILDILTQATNTAFILEPIRTATYALTLGQEMAGLNRVIGGFPEASSYSYVSLGLLGFWLNYWFHDRSGSRLPLVLMLVMLFLVLRGTSSSAYVGLALLAIIFLTIQLRSMAYAGSGAMDQRLILAMACIAAAAPAVAFGLYVLYSVEPGFASFIDRSLLNKLSSDSGVERMSWNRQALINFWDTYMLGAGLGSVRASNWIVATLATTGVIGSVLMGSFLWRLFRMPLSALSDDGRRLALALQMGCVGCLCRAVVVKATPNLDFLFFGMAGMIVGLSLSAARRSEPIPDTPRTSQHQQGAIA